MKHLKSKPDCSVVFNENVRIRFVFKGIVQGVGFRPYLYRSAMEFGLTGLVKNTSAGVVMEVEGDREKIEPFKVYIVENNPPLSKIDQYTCEEIPLENSSEFVILKSEETSHQDLLVPPDIALCDNCKKEFLDPKDRRHRYPFINCTDCGPRFTIINDLPYDRPKTTMSIFEMCPACSKEYQDPLDRRYHAQPVSCYDCGPELTFSGGGEDPVKAACERIKRGDVVALKGLGGYHLACLASSIDAVGRMREYKRRPFKPFALMGTLEMVESCCVVSEAEKKLLQNVTAPIILLEKRKHISVSEKVAPGQTNLGFMLPYTPLHLLLLEDIGEPLVMTSANFSDEPIIYTEEFEELAKLSDHVLSHNRRINIFADDSVASVFEDQMYMIRRSRGYVPMPLDLSFPQSPTVLGFGPMLKTTFAFIHNRKGLMSQYIGDTDSPVAVEAERSAIHHYARILSLTPEKIAIDMHPQYPNRQILEDFVGTEVVEIQHHKAHVASLLAERSEVDPIIGVSFDGTGYGEDGKIWGGEIFIGDYRGMERFGHLVYQDLPSGDQSAKEPWRFALSILFSLYGKQGRTLEFAERFGKRGTLLLEVIEKKIKSIETSSCGRLFDAVSCLCGLGDQNHYEGELPILLQACAESGSPHDRVYPFPIEQDQDQRILNYLPLLDALLQDKAPVSERAYVFHQTLANGILRMAQLARKESGLTTVGLTGGVFQNILLLTLTKHKLEANGFVVLNHSLVPTNDGGVSLGQALLAAYKN